MAADSTPATSSRASASPSKTVVERAAFPVLTCVLAALVTWIVCYWMGADGSLTLLVSTRCENGGKGLRRHWSGRTKCRLRECLQFSRGDCHVGTNSATVSL